MGTTVSLLLPERLAHAGTEAVRALFAHWEHTLSRFHPESELSRLNARAGEAVRVSPLLYDVIDAVIEAARLTGGLFDPTMLRQLALLGYDRSFDLLPVRLPRALSVPGPGGGWRAITLDPARRHVTLPRGVGLDLGGIAKGLAVDAALARLQALDITAALVNAGGDLAVYGLPPGAAAWPISAPTRQGATTVALYHGALATSSVSRRRWRQGDQDYHHLLDPRSGLPAQGGVWSVSVGAARCAEAEVAAKVACVLGASGGVNFLHAHGLPGLLVEESGACRTTGGWPTPAGEEAAA